MGLLRLQSSAEQQESPCAAARMDVHVVTVEYMGKQLFGILPRCLEAPAFGESIKLLQVLVESIDSTEFNLDSTLIQLVERLNRPLIQSFPYFLQYFDSTS